MPDPCDSEPKGGISLEALTIRNLAFSYPEQREKAVDSFSLTLRAGEFAVLCGPSGCGKSTLLRQLKPVLAPHGVQTGEILLDGVPVSALSPRDQSARIGFVGQSPENQLVTDKVWHELAFGLESLGCDTPAIRRRVAEMAAFFGIEDWFYQDTADLSGGQKQLLNLAAVMVMQPELLILDEPTGQLDPIAASEFLSTLGRLNRELGVTILLTEHRLEEVFPLADRVAVMEQGRLLCEGTPAEIGPSLLRRGHGMFLAMPAAMRIWAACGGAGPCPVTVREGRSWLTAYGKEHPLQPLPPETVPPPSRTTAAEARDLWFRYEKDRPDVVKGLSLTIARGEFLALLGGNGAGKTTALRLFSGERLPQRGEVHIHGRVGVLPQDPKTLFVKKTVREDLLELIRDRGLPAEAQAEAAARTVRLCQLEALLDRHPYDLSGGEQQRAALAKVLLTDPEILLLDEPTKGLDAECKLRFAQILRALLRRGVTVLMVSHDVEFCARYAHRCALFFDGSVTAEGSPRAFFSGNSFYTTPANRMSRPLLPEAVTAEDVITACGGSLPAEPPLPPLEEALSLPEPERASPHSPTPPLSRWRKALAGLSLAAALAVCLRAAGGTDLSALVSSGEAAGETFLRYALCLAALFVFALAVGRRSPPPIRIQTPREHRRLSRRTGAACVMVLLCIPLTLFAGLVYLDNRQYYLVMVLVLAECMLPFFLLFEGRRPQARELVVLASLCAIGVASRALFFMLPECKPVLAITILAGVAFGGESGFLTGAVIMLVSNILFGQGPWTPWQMFALGLIGFLAGLLFRKGLLRRTRASLCVFGAIVSIVIYGGIMNPMSQLMWARELDPSMLLTYYLTGFPLDCIRGGFTALFLWLTAEPILEKLDRIKTKYGLVE